LRGKRVARGLEASHPMRVFRLFTTEITLDQTWGKCYHFIRPIHHIKYLLTLKQLLCMYVCMYVRKDWAKIHPALALCPSRSTLIEAVTKCDAPFYCYNLPQRVIINVMMKNVFIG
jgi:hypothetical protein